MQFLKDLLRNIAVLVIIGLILLVMFPTLMSQVFQFYGAIFGPLAILLVIAAAMPRRKRRSR